MKVKKYGSFNLNPTELQFAIVIQVLVGEIKEEKIQYRFVTEIDRQSKIWKAENQKEAVYFDSRSVAQDFCMCMKSNGVSAFVVEVLGRNMLKNWW